MKFTILWLALSLIFISASSIIFPGGRQGQSDFFKSSSHHDTLVIISTLPGPWTRGIREESSWGPGDDNHNVDVHCFHDVDDGGGRDE